MSTTAKQGKYGFLIDVSYCIDCRACNVSCSVQNNVSMTSTRIWMKGSGVMGEFPNLQSYTAPFHCMHCNDPSCVSACTVGALQRDGDGIVQYDDDRCIGCRYCVYACPFGVPNMDLNERFPLIVKCDMCGERLAEGEQPACAATCPPGAIKFGLRQDMLDEAYRRIDEQPGKYVNHVYGEHENGGTSTFYISPVPFEELDFPIAGETSPAYYNRLVTHGTPTVAGGVALGLTGTYLTINNLKQEAAEEAAEKAAQKAETEDDKVNKEIS